MEKSSNIYSIQIYLKAHSSLSANDLVVRLWVCNSYVGCLNAARAAYCNSLYNNLS